MLAVAIPEYRLPKSLLASEIDNLKKLGIEIKLNTEIGKNIRLEDLRKNYNAVFIAAGAHKGLKLGIPGEESKGVIDAVDLLREVNLGRKPEIDAVRTINRLGKKVVLLYRRTKSEMPAWEEEVDEAIAEGIDIQFLVAPVKVITEKGRVSKLECIRMELGDVDRSGRRKPVPIEGSGFTIDIDTLVPAISQEPDIGQLISGEAAKQLKLSKWNTIEVDGETLYCGAEGIFAGGDVVLGPKTVTEAMSHGMIAAEMIDKYIKGEPLLRQYSVTKPAMDVPLMEMSEEEIESLQRFEMPMLDVKDRINNFIETELGFSMAAAVCEAKHCLRCDKEEKE
jgi:NADH-quinone oxidoreductase subunit F